jgi:hypothetical protein
VTRLHRLHHERTEYRFRLTTKDSFDSMEISVRIFVTIFLFPFFARLN